MKAINIFFLLLFVFPFTLISQNSMTGSPYSMFGIGEFTKGKYGQNAGMGGVAYGMREFSLLNVDNPAGLTGLDSAKLFAETSVFVKNEMYRSKGSSNNVFTGNLAAFSLGGRLMPGWYAAVSLTPYSVVGYYFNSSQPIEGAYNSNYTTLYQGSGGLNKATLTNSFLLPGNFSFGVNLSYIFGTIQHIESQTSIAISNKTYTHNFYADFGLQYHRAIGKRTFITIGGVYGYKQKLAMDNTLAVQGSSTYTEYPKNNSTQYLPQFYGLGGALQHKKWVYALDYAYHEYSAISSGDSRVKFKDVHEVKAGFSFLPSDYSYEGYRKKIIYKGGIAFSTPYYRFSGSSGYTWKVTGGLGFPLLGGHLNSSLYYEQLRMGTNVLSKKEVGLVLTYTLSERFYRVKL